MSSENTNAYQQAQSKKANGASRIHFLASLKISSLQRQRTIRQQASGRRRRASSVMNARLLYMLKYKPMYRTIHSYTHMCNEWIPCSILFI